MEDRVPDASSFSPVIATCLHGVQTVARNGVLLHDSGPEAWEPVFTEIAAIGFDHAELSDTHLRLADVDSIRRQEILATAREAGVSIPSLHVQRRSILAPGLERENLDYAHRSIDAAAECGIQVLSTGLHQPLSAAQQEALWFWTAQGALDSHSSEIWGKAVHGFRELGRHAAEVGMLLSLELYEDTLLGTADSAVQLVQDIDLGNVGLNPDVGNLVRLHRNVEDWQEVYAKTLPYANYWHLKNYARDEAADGSWFTSTPSSLELGLINYRQVVQDAMALGYNGIFLMEHYGGDSLGMCRSNAVYLRSLFATVPHYVLAAAESAH